ncbi:MAG: YCF48-related protein [Candidatus Sulfotelmatobacter sp.]|jgi:hypothetical protein
MQNVPKIVRERLKATTPAADHPDADALTAFAERLLAERERDVVLDHLGHCGDCRDIVALALPATETLETAVRPAARAWLTWPALRWGFVVAGVVAIASLGIVQHQRSVRPQNTASKSPARVEVATNEPKDQALAPPVSSGAPAKSDKIETPPAYAAGTPVATFNEKKSGARAEEPRASVPQPQVGVGRDAALAVGGQLPHGPRLANQWQQNNMVQNQGPGAPPSPSAKQQAAGDLSANMQVPAVSETVAVETQSAELDTQTQIQDKPAAPQPSNRDYVLSRVGKAKPAATSQTASSGALASTVATPTAPVIGGAAFAPSAPVPRWTINSAGGLQRSFDQGATWQLVDVNANPAYFMDATSLRIVGKTSRAKSKDASQALKRDDASPIFRAVAANGTDVWAGGSGGILYHSPDAGDQWTRVVPASAGTSLTGDIVSLEFSDMQHGKVATSTAEIWITSDDGQTWQKQ